MGTVTRPCHAVDDERNKREKAEREAAIKEEEERERIEKAAENAEFEKRAVQIAKDAAIARAKAGRALHSSHFSAH